MVFQMKCKIDEDLCPFCGGLLHWYMRRELVQVDESDYQTDFVDYQECENWNKEPTESGNYEGVW